MHKILLADDDNDFRGVLRDILKGEGFSVVEAPDGSRAFELFKEAFPDLLILDLQMPGLDGLETTRAVREINPVVPIIILTGHGDITSAITATKLRALDFIAKPPNFAVLLATVNKALEIVESENLSLRELAVLNFIKEGKTNPEVASALNLSVYTVGSFRNRILHKLHAATSAQAVAIAIQKGLITSDTISIPKKEDKPEEPEAAESFMNDIERIPDKPE